MNIGTRNERALAEKAGRSQRPVRTFASVALAVVRQAGTSVQRHGWQYQITRIVLLAIAVFGLFVVAYFSVGWFLDEQQAQQELKRDIGPQNVNQQP